ncbi:MAG: peptidylprolyl isomerase [Acidimicrobiales bacterium]
MPSEKRARQRAQRQVKLSQAQVRKKRVRRLRQGISALVIAGLVVLVIVLVSQPAKPKKAASSTTTTTTTTSTTTTTTPKPVQAVAPTCPPTTSAGAAKRETKFTHEPPICITRGVTYDATVTTDVGTFVVQLLPSAQLRAVDNFVFLARYHFFNGIIFHRVIPGFVVQGGDPTGSGSGGPGYEWTGNEPPKSCTAAKNCYAPYDLAYADSGSSTRTNGSQFFIVLPGGQAQLTPNYTLFGKVISGRAVVNKIATDGSSTGVPKVTHHMVSVTISTAAG